MDAQPGSKSLRTALNVLLLLLIVVHLGGLAVMVPDWVGGAAPAYPGQYENRIFGVLTLVPMLSAVQLIQRNAPRAPNWGRLTLTYALLALGVISMLVDVSRA